MKLKHFVVTGLLSLFSVLAQAQVTQSVTGKVCKVGFTAGFPNGVSTSSVTVVVAPAGNCVPTGGQLLYSAIYFGEGTVLQGYNPALMFPNARFMGILAMADRARIAGSVCELSYQVNPGNYLQGYAIECK